MEPTKQTHKFIKTKGLDVVGIPLGNIRHKDGKYTLIFRGTTSYWVESQDLHDSWEEAEKSRQASYLY